MDFLHSEIGSAKDNFYSPVHNWYKFTAGFSYKFVEAILEGEKNSQNIVFEPFAGCGTTLVSSQKCGVKAIGNEGQEFMLDIIKAKLYWNIDKTECINSLNYIDSYIKEHLTNFSMEEVHPLLSTLYDNETLKVLYLTRDSLDHISNDKIRLFLKLALSQTMHKVGLYPIAVPYISRTKRMANSGHAFARFQSIVLQMLEDIGPLQNIEQTSEIYLHDSRFENPNIGDSICNYCITSPPYLNNLDYGEVSKVHTHFFGLTENWNDITQKVRKNLVTGATTHYRDIDFDINIFKENDFSKENQLVFDELFTSYIQIMEIAKTRNGKKSFNILMMHYFEDMYYVLKEMRRVLKKGSKAYLILGDSAPYGIYIPTTELLGRIAYSVGFNKYHIYIIRTRGTKWKSLKYRHNIELSENVLVLE